jgi:hypothetical protein
MPRSAIARLSSIALCAGCALALLGQPAVADVTIQRQSTYDLTFITAHDTSTDYISGDKQRSDSEVRCDGMMSLLCRKIGGGEITRLDKDLVWTLNPKDKEYTETHFPTPAERQAAEEKMRAMLEKLKQCPARQGSNTPDTSKCQMSPAKVESHQTDQHQTIAGHDARLSQVTLTESCHTPDNSDTCDFVVTLDSWLTQDELPGSAERKAFAESYLKKLGLTDANGSLQKMLQGFLAQYGDALKEVSAKAKDFKGYPLKTSIRIMFGGAQCAAAKKSAGSGSTASGGAVADASTAAGQAAASSSTGEAQSAAGQAAQNAAGNGVAGRIFGSAAGAFTNKLAGGLFGKKPAATPATAATADAPPVPPNMVLFATITVETSSITTTPIAADEFEIPAGWKLNTPKANKAEDKEFTCPRT